MRKPKKYLVSDEELVAQVTGEDHKAFLTLYERHSWIVKAILHLILRGHFLEEDAFQNTWLHVYNGITTGHYKNEKHFLQWLKQITRNEVYDILASEKHTAGHVHIDEVTSELLIDYLTPEELLNRKMRAEVCRESILKLPRVQRDFVWLRYIKGISYEEIAERKGCSVATARSLVAKGMAKLRKAYGA